MKSEITSDIDIKSLIGMMTFGVCTQLDNWLNAQKELLADDLPMDLSDWPLMVQESVVQKTVVQKTETVTAPRTQVEPERRPPERQIVSQNNAEGGTLASFHAMQHARNKKQLTTLSEREKALDELEGRASACRMCPLHATREQIMWSTGPADATIMFIAAGGNPEEPACGRIMTGEAAELLDKITNAMGQLHSEASAGRIYTTNLIKCACVPPRQKIQEIARSCLTYLRQEVRIVSPKVIVVWGTLVYQTMFGGSDPISQVRGKWQTFEGIPTIATHHPLEMIKNPKLKGRVWGDLQLAVAKIKEL